MLALVRVPALVLLVGLALAASAIWAAGSSRGAVTLGSALATEPNGITICSASGSDRGCLAVNDVLPGRQLASPFLGVIVRWRARLGTSTEAQTIRIRVVRRLDGDRFKVISSGALESVADGAGTYAFPARLAINAGDGVGIESGSDTAIEWRAPLTGANTFEYAAPTPLDGGETATPTFTDADQEHTFNVDVEPDLDSDVFGDETQDMCLGTPGQFNGCPNTVTIGKPKQKGTKVKLPLTVPGPGTVRAGSANDPALATAAKAKPLLKAVSKSFTANTRQQATLVLKLTKAAKAKLADKRKLKLKIKVSFTPTGGPAGSQTAKAKLKS
jgi:hypothetical protein